MAAVAPQSAAGGAANGAMGQAAPRQAVRSRGDLARVLRCLLPPALCSHLLSHYCHTCACDCHGYTHVPVHGDAYNADARDTQADPLEEHNIALANQAVVERMAARARELMADAPPQAGAVHAVFRYLMAFLLVSSTVLVALVSLLGWCVVRRCRRSWAPFVAPGSSSRSATHGSRGRDNVNSHEHFD